MDLEECRPAPSFLSGGDEKSPHRLHSRGIPGAEDAGGTAPQPPPAWKIGFACPVCSMQSLAMGALKLQGLRNGDIGPRPSLLGSVLPLKVFLEQK